LMVYLEVNNVKIEDVMDELKKRQKWVMIKIIYLLKS
jgi:phosphoribosyl-ATP pyrophosphohydrolase